MDSMMSLDVSKDEFCSGEETPVVVMFRAVKQGDVVRARDLLQKTGTDVLQARNSQGLTLLHCAVKKSHLEMVRLLLQWPAVDLEAVTPNGETALYLAAGRGYTQILLTMLDHGAHPDGGEGRFMTAFDEMMRNFCDPNRQRWDEAMCAMLKRGAKCNRIYLGKHDSVFGWICGHGLTECASILMTNQQLLYAPGEDRHVILGALRKAMHRNKADIVALFAQQWGVCFSETAMYGIKFDSLFHEAVVSGQLDVVRVFLDHVVNINQKQTWKIDGDWWPITPVELAIICRHEEIAIELFERGVDRTVRGTTRWIHDAIGHGCEHLVMYLLDKNTDLPLEWHDEFPVPPLYRVVTPVDQKYTERLILDKSPATHKLIMQKYSHVIESGLLHRYPLVKLGQLLFLTMTGRAALTTLTVSEGESATQKHKWQLHTVLFMMRRHMLPWEIQKIILRTAMRRHRIMRKGDYKTLFKWVNLWDHH